MTRVLRRTAAVLTLVGFVAGCAQQDGAWRQARVDSYCHDPRIGSSPQAVGQCLQYYVRNSNIEVPDTSRLPSLATYTPSPAAVPPPYTSPSYPPLPSRLSTQGRTEVTLSQSGRGTFHVSVIINDAVRVPFIIDSGAADVTIPGDVMLTLMRSGTINDSDFLGKQTYILANGSKVPSTTFRIRSLRVGDKVLENVTAGTTSASGEPLLGQSFLSRFRSWSIDNRRGVLVLE